MSSGKYRVLFLIISLFLLQINIVVAGTTGKISGRILDKETGEALIGVNVIIKGSSLGAATDIDGYFAILSIPPGVHTIIASMVGYSVITVNDVRVLIDQTTPIDLQMTPQSIEAAAVDVVAERNVIKKDVSTSVTSVQTEEIQSLPVSSIDQVVGLQAGVEDGMVIRGGTADQLLLQVDGVTQRDPRNNSPMSTVALTSIEEVAVEKGGFNAEYGQVQSGVINIIGKEGSASKYSGAIQAKVSPPAPKSFGESVYDPNSMWNRPYLDPAVCWTGTTNGNWDYYTQKQYPSFAGWNAVSQSLLASNNPALYLSPAACQREWEWEHRRRPETNQPDYNIDASLGGPVPSISSLLGNLRFFTSFVLNREMFLIPLTRDDYKEFNWSVKVNSDINKDMKLMLTANTGKYYTTAMNNPEENFNTPTVFGIASPSAYYPTAYFTSDPITFAQMLADQRDCKIYSDGWYSGVEVGNVTLGAKFTHVITPTTFYEVSLEHVNRQYNVGHIADRDTAKIYEVVPGYYVDEAPYGFSASSTNSPITGMFLGGHSGEIIDSTVVNSYTAKFDLTSQVNKSNMVKFGVEFNTYDLKLNYEEVEPGYGSFKDVNSDYKPFQFATYLQDKIEMYGFIANVGLRMDVDDPNTEWAAVSEWDKAFYGSAYSPDSSYVEQKAKVQVNFSPRLGISFPITENSKLYFNYGHFEQLPAYDQIFRIGRGSDNSLSFIGDPNLLQERTIAYELGYDHVLFNYYLLQIQAYYRDISNMQGYTNYSSNLNSIGYTEANSNNYADILGFELTLRKTEGDWLRGFATYTYQVITNGSFGETAVTDDPAEQRAIDENTQSQYQQRPIPQPHARMSLTFITPKDFGPSYSGVRPLDNWSLNILADWRAGQWMNYNPNEAPDNLNVPNVQCSDYFNMDLRINKSFSFSKFTVMLFMEVRNLLNIKRLSGKGFYDTDDQIAYFNSLHLPASDAYDNIPGNDRIGDYRPNGVAFQPIEQTGNYQNLAPTDIHYTANGQSAIYYNTPTGQYWRYNPMSNQWSQVPSGEMQTILNKKAYIDMPNDDSVNFLDPRQFFFGVNLSFNF